jgi:hypothetical protein
MTKLVCKHPTKTLLKGGVYKGIPIRKSKPDGSYNGRYTTRWVPCSQKDATSFEVVDSLGIIRRVSRKRFF